MRWTAKTTTGLRPGLTLVQLESLVASGALRGDDELQAESVQPGQVPRWQRVDETPYLRRALRSTPADGTTLALTGPLTDDAIASLLAAESDAPRMRRLQKIASVLRIAAATLLMLEAWVLVRAMLGS